MELEDVFLKRRSIRKFTDKNVEEDKIDKILYYAMTAPSACNKQPWEFYVIKDKAILEQLKKASLFSRYNAPLAIVVCGNLERSLPKELNEYWVQDCSASIAYMLLEISNLDLGGVWCGLHPQKTPVKKVKEILSLNDNVVPLGLVLIGYPNERLEQKSKYDSSKVHVI